MSKKILIVTYYWPPSGGVGVQRWMHFALELKKRGWHPTILTPKNPQFAIKDEKLLDKVKDLPTLQVPIWEPFDLFHQLTGGKEKKNVQQGLVLEKSTQTWTDTLAVWIRGNLLIPDPRVFWVRKATQAAIAFVKKEDPHCIITTGPPHSVHLVGRHTKRKTQVRWLADFRDPWSKWDILTKLKTSALVRSIHETLEKKVLKDADITTTVSPRLAELLGKNSHPAALLYNGLEMAPPITTNPEEGKFVIGYFGMLNELRNPIQLWMMLDQWCREDADFSDKLVIRIGGIVSASIKEEIEKLERLQDKVQFLGYLPHDNLQKEYQKCHLLLLLLNKSDNARWILPMKFFEYLGARRMILCLGERASDLGDLIVHAEIGDIFDYGQVQQIRAFIFAVYKNTIPFNLEKNDTLLSTFSLENRTNILEDLIQKK